MTLPKGAISAVITPMKSDGSVDYDTYAHQVDFLAAQGVNGYFINGTTAEGAYLSTEERARCLELAQEHKKPEQFICLACLAASTSEAVEQVKFFEKFHPDYFVIVPPYYFAADGKMIQQHYLTLANATDVPLIIYNIPQRTANDAFAADVATLISTGKFAGMKDSSGDFIRFSRWVLEADRQFSWIQGEDLLDAESLFVGASGVVSGLSNIFPRPFVKMYEASQTGDYRSMVECQRIINKLGTIIDVCDGKGIAAIKAAVSILGRCEMWTRLEAEPLPESSISKIKKIIDSVAMVL
jgi:4-hydroxy-tetrahydrodipicolinate synthase